MNFYTSLEKNKKKIEEILPVKKSFDIVTRDLVFANNINAYLIFVDGFAKDDMMLWILERLQQTSESEITDIKKWMDKNIGYIESEIITDFDQLTTGVLSGAAVIVIDNQKKAILLDVRSYPARGPAEPDLEKVTRGSRDGLVETIVFNTALIRRRLRDPNFVCEISSVGKRSKSDVVLAYIDDLVDKDLLDTIRDKINNIEVDALIMGEKSLEELLFKKKWYNPLPQARFTERPDVVAAHLLEGHIGIIVDNSPSVLLLPVTIFHFTQHSEDYYQNPLVGTYIKWIRMSAMIISLMLTPLWLVLVQNIDKLPEYLQFIGPRDEFTIPIFIQFLLLEFGLDTLRVASIHTPSALSTSLGIIGGLILSQIAVDVGWFVPETVLYMAVVGLGTFASSSIEFALAVRMFRLFLLLLTGLFNTIGFIIGLIIVLIITFTTKTIGKVHFTWPLFPFNAKALGHVIFRQPIIQIKRNNNKSE